MNPLVIIGLLIGGYALLNKSKKSQSETRRATAEQDNNRPPLNVNEQPDVTTIGRPSSDTSDNNVVTQSGGKFKQPKFLSITWKGEVLAVPTKQEERVQMSNELVQKASNLANAMQSGEIPMDMDKLRKIQQMAAFVANLTDQRLLSEGQPLNLGINPAGNGVETAMNLDNGALSFEGKPNFNRIKRRNSKRPKIVSKPFNI